MGTISAVVWITALLIAGLGGIAALGAALQGNAPIANTIGAIPLLALGGTGVYLIVLLAWRKIRGPQC
jgi:hypothetical protein